MFELDGCAFEDSGEYMLEVEAVLVGQEFSVTKHYVEFARFLIGDADC